MTEEASRDHARHPFDGVDVAVVGGGPAGAVVASLLAARGRSVVLFERQPAYRWHASGVFSGPAVRPLFARLGVTDAALAAMARTIPAMRLETPSGTTVRLTYGADRGGAPALAFDRRRLDDAVLGLAVANGVSVCRGSTVESVAIGRVSPTVTVRDPDGEQRRLTAGIVVGADGIRSTLARAAGVARRPQLVRIGITFHVAEDGPADAAGPLDGSVDARMVIGADTYCGLAPVPDGRVNVGIVSRGRAIDRLRRLGANEASQAVLARLPDPGPDAVRLAPRHQPLDRPEGASPLGHRVARRAGPGWLLVGDAAGFLDPFTGEGLHRALASAFLAAEAVDRHLAGRAGALGAYDRAMRGRFAAKDGVSLLVQAFLARPALFEYAARRLARRDAVRQTLELVLGDLVPAARAFDPRFLAALLAP